MYQRIQLEKTSEGARKAWETRKHILKVIGHDAEGHEIHAPTTTRWYHKGFTAQLKELIYQADRSRRTSDEDFGTNTYGHTAPEARAIGDSAYGIGYLVSTGRLSAAADIQLDKLTGAQTFRLAAATAHMGEYERKAYLEQYAKRLESKSK